VTDGVGQTRRVNMRHPVNTFRPVYALGTTVDRVPSKRPIPSLRRTRSRKSWLRAGASSVIARIQTCSCRHGTGIQEARGATPRVQVTLRAIRLLSRNSFDTPKSWPDAQGRTSWLVRFLDYLKARGRLQDLAFMSFEHYPYDGGETPWKNLYEEPRLIEHTCRCGAMMAYHREFLCSIQKP
jgi:hypothetical protein